MARKIDLFNRSEKSSIKGENMDFNDSPQEAKFREEVRTWLKDHVPSAKEMYGLDYIEKAKLWQKRKYDAGWACIRWPVEY